MRKILPLTCVILLLTTCILGILYFNGSSKAEEETTSDIPLQKTVLRSRVEAGIITSTLILNGNVIGDMPELYIENISVVFENESNSSDFDTIHKVGDTLKKGDVLYSYKGEKTKVDGNCKIVAMIESEQAVHLSLLNYDRLYVIARIELDMIEQLDIGTKVSLTPIYGDTETTYEGKIVNLGYEVRDGMVEVQIHCDENLLPGTPLRIDVEIIRETESMYILKQMLLMDTNTYYVEIDDRDNLRTRREVEIGEFFDMYIDGAKYEYVEINSGLNVGENLIVDIIE